MEKQCKTVPVVPYEDGFPGPVYSEDCNRFQTARKLYDEVTKDIVLIRTSTDPHNIGDTGFGTGFFVNKGDEIVTNAHVVTAMPYLEVVTQDGKHYQGKIEKLDDLNDMAVVKVIGKDPNDKPSLKIDNDTTDLKNGDEVIAFGYPRGFGNFDVFANPGRYREHGTMLGFLPGKDPSQYPDLQEMKNRAGQINNPSYSAEVEQYLNSERIRNSMAIFGGNSGGPAVDADGRVVGVMANRVSGARALMVPAEKLSEFINKPETKFNFKYEIDEHNHYKLAEIERKDGSGLPPVILPFIKKAAAPRDPTLSQF
ncbi:MAG: serine protease [Candidatus Obscuribacterales bacterium]|jgi:S1-C subfamily serine protease|nr:serine protease [Candidatus Obscuribacterales bacterium]